MKFKINQKGNFVLLEVEQIVEAYGWNDSNTCTLEYFDSGLDNQENEIVVKKTRVIYEPIKSVIRKIESERTRKNLRMNKRQKEVFSRWKMKG
jgi:hypothetical protein|nr:MAG TPA: hypothetical protein [Caudoviricetes sp.]